jgi:glycosyltransferase involved in cell wall biosynthesis
MKEELVSIITPCYNGENFINRLLDSLLQQTYSNFELIFVDDGSNDKTKEVVLSYKESFENKNIKLIYIYQQNSGQAEAINTGLKKVSGKYLCWPDSDDYLEPRSLEKRVRILEKFPEYAVVTSDAFIRNIKDLSGFTRLASAGQPGRFEENQFELLLSGNSMFLPGTHMARMNCFNKAHPSGRIVPSRGGQNWQILLPLYFLYKRYFLDEPLYNYIVYQSSHSQGDNTEEKNIYRCNEHENIIIETLTPMKIESSLKERYIFETKIRYTRKRLTIAFLYKNELLIKQMYSILAKENQPRRKEFLYTLIIKNIYVYKIFKKILPVIRSAFK